MKKVGEILESHRIGLGGAVILALFVFIGGYNVASSRVATDNELDFESATPLTVEEISEQVPGDSSTTTNARWQEEIERLEAMGEPWVQVGSGERPASVVADCQAKAEKGEAGRICGMALAAETGSLEPGIYSVSELDRALAKDGF